MEEHLKLIIQKLDHLEKRIEMIERHLGITPPVSPEEIPLIKRAINILLKNSQASTFLLQKELLLTPIESMRLYNSLEQLGIIKTKEVNNDSLQPSKVGSISKYKIRKFLNDNR